MTDKIDELIQSLVRGSIVHLRGDLLTPPGAYRVLAKRLPDYIKLQKGSASPVELPYAKLMQQIDMARGQSQK